MLLVSWSFEAQRALCSLQAQQALVGGFGDVVLRDDGPGDIDSDVDSDDVDVLLIEFFLLVAKYTKKYDYEFLF